MRKSTKENILILWISFIGFTLLVVPFSAWIQHFITSINEELWVLLVIGVFVFPIGILHGFLVWFGVV